jgi:predicted transcriptional regulator
MTTLSIRLPDSTHSRLRSWAHQDKLSINQFISTAVAEKLAALETLDYIDARGKRASKAAFDKALASVPRGTTVAQDRWPA